MVWYKSNDRRKKIRSGNGKAYIRIYDNCFTIHLWANNRF